MSDLQACTKVEDVLVDRLPGLDQARADALADLVLSNASVTAKITLGSPVITGTDAADAKHAAAAAATAAADGRTTGVAGTGLDSDFSVLASLNGCEVPSIGFIDADTVEALLAIAPRRDPFPAEPPF